MKCEYFKNFNQRVYHPLMLLKLESPTQPRYKPVDIFCQRNGIMSLVENVFVDTVMFVGIGIQIEYS